MALPLALTSFLQLKQLYVQWEMLEQLEQKELLTLTADSKDIQWIRQGRECMVQGRLFDVKFEKKNGNRITLTGLYDEREKELKQLIDKHSKPTHESYSLRQLFFLLTQLSVPQIQIYSFESLALQVKANRSVKPSFYSGPSFDLQDPPPDRTLTITG